MLIIFLSNFLFYSEKSLIKMVKKAVSTGKMSKKVWLNYILKNTFEIYFL